MKKKNINIDPQINMQGQCQKIINKKYEKKILIDVVEESSIFFFYCEVNNYIVRSYRDVIVVANIVTRRTSKA